MASHCHCWRSRIGLAWGRVGIDHHHQGDDRWRVVQAFADVIQRVTTAIGKLRRAAAQQGAGSQGFACQAATGEHQRSGGGHRQVFRSL